MDHKSSNSKEIIIPRITQLDACNFDNEIQKILFNVIMEISKHLKPGTLNNFKSELNLLLNIIIFKYSVAKRNATFGQELVGLKYKNFITRSELFFYAIFKFLLPYLRIKCEETSRIDNTVISIIVKKVELIYKACNFFNLLIFLVQGKYPTITERLLSLKYVPTHKYNRSVGYHFMTRQLVWFGLMELLKQIWPLINYNILRRKFKMMFLPKTVAGSVKSQNINIKNFKCVICNEFLVTPCKISQNCPHLACYYCLKSNILLDDKFMCPECYETNTASEKIEFLQMNDL